MSFSWTTVFVKYVLFGFNLVFVITGIILMSVGITIKAEYENYLTFLEYKYISTPNFLIAIGVIIFFIAFFGCCGASKENFCMLKTFAALMILIFILELSAGISGYVLRNQTSDFLEAKLNDSLTKYNSTVNPDITNTWDAIQKTFYCCGVNGPKDWHLKVLNETNGIPTSCCNPKSGAISVFHCSTNENNINNVKPYETGCVTAFGNYIKDHAYTLGAIGLGIGFIQLLGIFFSWFLAKQVQKNYNVM